jgi:hypothetical protein
MPKAVRQSPPRQPPPIVAPAGSILSEGVPIEELERAWIKMVLYGENGSGKTHLACDFEKPLALISWEPGDSGSGGAETVRKVPGITYFRMKATKHENPDGSFVIEEKASEKFVRFATELRKSNPFRTVVIDSVTSMQEVVLAELMGVEELPPQLNIRSVPDGMYTTRAEQCKSILRPWLNLPCHVIFIGKEIDHYRPKEPERDAKGKVKVDMRPRFVRGMEVGSKFAVALGGATAGWLNDGCDYICRLYMDKVMVNVAGVMVESDKYVRCLRIGFHPNFAARFRSCDFENLPDEIPEPSYEKIVAAIEGRYKAE